MSGIEVARKVKEAHQCLLFRQVEGAQGHEYETKPWEGEGDEPEEEGAEPQGWILLDAYSASAVCTVWDALSESNRQKLAKYNLVGMVRVAFKLLK